MAETELEHYGIKGMKWGQHKAKRAFVKDAKSSSTANIVFKQATSSPEFKRKLNAINNDPAFKGKDLSKDARLRSQYNGVVAKTFNQQLAATSISKTYNKDFNRAVVWQMNPNGQTMKATLVKPRTVKHEDDNATATEFPEFKITRDEKGFVVSFDVIEKSMKQSDDLANDFLEHYGIKGMHWGQRKSRSKPSASKPSSRQAQAKATRKKMGKRALIGVGTSVAATMLTSAAVNKAFAVSPLDPNHGSLGLKHVGQVLDKFGLLKLNS